MVTFESTGLVMISKTMVTADSDYVAGLIITDIGAICISNIVFLFGANERTGTRL
jgi:hypothetical protein